MGNDLSPNDFFKTSDMALVTFMRVEGHTPQDVDFIDDTCFWWFMITDAMMETVQTFGAREGQVEPREYSKMFSVTKDEFYSSRNSRS